MSSREKGYLEELERLERGPDSTDSPFLLDLLRLRDELEEESRDLLAAHVTLEIHGFTAESKAVLESSEKLRELWTKACSLVDSWISDSMSKD